MKITPIKTPVVQPGQDLNQLITQVIPKIEERTVLVMASKIFSFAENRLIKKQTDRKDEKWELAKQEAEYWLDPDESKYQCMLTVKGNWMFANAGIDESNALGDAYALWPKDPQASVDQVWEFIRTHYGISKVGVIMTDSRSTPLNWGVVGHGIAHSGFEALYSYIGQDDIFGRQMQMERVSVVQSLAVAGAYVMGEGSEQTPIALITNIPQISFQTRVPSKAEIEAIKPSLKDDIYAPLLTRAPWKKGQGGIE
jgi:dihydrofolate synthase / folylpolyglutamate synthase